MSHHARRAITVAVTAGALLALGAGLAYADDNDDNGDSGPHAAPHQTEPGTGSGLSGGPTEFGVLQGAPGVPVPDPTFGEGTVLPPVYNGYSAVTGS
jgi:hypothetical protein